MIEFVKSNLEILASLYLEVVNLGGFREVIAEKKWARAQKRVFFTSSFDPTKCRKIYETFLYRFEKTKNSESLCKLDMQKDGCSLEDIDPALLREVKVYPLIKKEDLT